MSDYTPPIRIAIADDHELFREGLKSMINKKYPDLIKIVTEAENGEELIRGVYETKPDVVITDIKMPKMDGFQASRHITTEHPDIKVIALSMLEETSAIYDMFEAGAKGYLMKNTHITEVFDAIQTVNNGEMHYCSSSSSSLIKKIGPSKYNTYKKNLEVRFCDTEVNIIKLICKELTTKEIADTLHFSARSIENYSKKIKDKMCAKNIVGIALYAVKNNMISINEIQFG